MSDHLRVQNTALVLASTYPMKGYFHYGSCELARPCLLMTVFQRSGCLGPIPFLTLPYPWIAVDARPSGANSFMISVDRKSEVNLSKGTRGGPGPHHSL
eukprot:4940577-Amphidinium_carterae.1